MENEKKGVWHRKDKVKYKTHVHWSHRGKEEK